jgi:hypothetical protein
MLEIAEVWMAETLLYFAFFFPLFERSILVR